MGKSLKITALTPEELAKLLSQAGRKTIAAADVREITETAGILSPDGTINLIDYAAFLAQEVSGVTD
jgi:hypothetical protein